MIRIYTKTRHISKISNFLTMKKLKHEIFTINETPPDTPFDLGVSYCYPRKISKELLDIPKIAFVNYHPGPLPEYKGPTEYEDAIENYLIVLNQDHQNISAISNLITALTHVSPNKNHPIILFCCLFFL